ncbi:MAG: hypothetical protein H0V61_01840 [Chitinophagales bacterium]|nr:hypothetical protein [Chitinophagales bacterium]
MNKLILAVAIVLTMHSAFAQVDNKNTNTNQNQNQNPAKDDQNKGKTEQVTTPDEHGQMQNQWTQPTNISNEAVPNGVSRLFLSQYELAQNPQWYQTSEGNYMVSYKDEKDHMESRLTYDKNGKLISTDRQVKDSDVPSNLSQYLSSKYPDQSTQNVFIGQDANGAKTYYVIRGNQLLRFDEKGNMISMEKK